MVNQLEQALNEALQDEYKARATYNLVISKFGAIRPFVNIIDSEQRHIEALMSLFRKYNFPIPADEWTDKIKPPSSLLEACQQGVQGAVRRRRHGRRP